MTTQNTRIWIGFIGEEKRNQNGKSKTKYDRHGVIFYYFQSYNVNREVNDAFYRYKMPAIMAKVEGKGNGIKTVIVNMIDIARSLNREPICKYTHSDIINPDHVTQILPNTSALNLVPKLILTTRTNVTL